MGLALAQRQVKLCYEGTMTFQIAELPAPGGGTLGICPLPGRWGDAVADFAMIRAWAPDIVVSMTETAEMERFNMADMGALLARDGVDWAHFPVRDFGVPENESIWAELASELHKVLDANGRVLVHCLGGLGRSGMVLLRLMVERGEQAEVALGQIREVRPGAVETDAQKDWVTNIR